MLADGDNLIFLSLPIPIDFVSRIIRPLVSSLSSNLYKVLSDRFKVSQIALFEAKQYPLFLLNPLIRDKRADSVTLKDLFIYATLIFMNFVFPFIIVK